MTIASHPGSGRSSTIKPAARKIVMFRLEVKGVTAGCTCNTQSGGVGICTLGVVARGEVLAGGGGGDICDGSVGD